MSLMTEEERRSILPPGIWVKSKCDQCGKPLGAKLYYRGARGEYCSDSCLQEAADLPEFRTKRRKVMIKKKSMQNKAADGAAESKVLRKKKKAKSASNPEPTPAASTTAPKTAPKPALHNPFRPGSVLHVAFQRLLDRGALTMAEMFEGLQTADPGRLIVDMRYRGKREGFDLKRSPDGKFQVVHAS